jgi:cytochrome c oxidase assembly factor CtaG
MTARRGIALIAGTVVFYLAVSPLVDGFADRNLVGHMLQHALIISVAAPLIALSEPIRTLLGLLGAEEGRRVVRVLRSRPGRAVSSPLFALCAFVATVLVTHLPRVYDFAIENDVPHAAEHLLYLVVGVLFWSVVVGADPTRRPLSLVGVSGFIVAGMVPMLAIGVVFVTSGHVLYAPYEEFASAHRVLSDQEVAATVMWIGDAPMALALVLAGWSSLAREERRQQVRERAMIMSERGA